jgi:uncharacterized protein (TIGR03437 family)
MPTRLAFLRAILCAILPTIACAPLAAQTPGIGQNGVYNAASHIAPTLAGGALAPGALVVIEGVRLGSSKSSTSASLLKDGARIPLETVAVQASRLEVLIPSSAPVGPASLVVTVNGESSLPFPVDMAPSNPGIFSRNGLGWGSGPSPARPSQIVRLRVTGLGNVRQPDVMVGNQVVRAENVRPTAQPGEEEISFRLPAHVAEGCNVPVALRITPLRVSNVVTLAVSNAIGIRPGNCERGPIPAITLNQRIGILILSRTRVKSRTAGPDPIYDEALGVFVALNEESKPSPLMLLPPAGTCTAYTSSFQSTTVMPNSFSSAFIAELGGIGLDAGPNLAISRNAPSRNAPPDTMPRNPNAPGFYTRLGNSDRHSGPRAARLLLPFLDPGEYMLHGTGGKDVGPFSIRLPGPEPFEWTDRDRTGTVTRSHGLTVHWRGVAPDRLVVILATNVDQISTAIGTSLCTARADAGRFTIPASLLANLPPSRDIPGIPYDRVLVASLPAKTASSIPAAGLNGGEVFSVFADSRIVEFK